MEKQKKNLGSVAFLPLIVFLVCYVGCGITFTLMGADDPFGKFPRHVALLAGCAVALLLNRSDRRKLQTACGDFFINVTGALFPLCLLHRPKSRSVHLSGYQRPGSVKDYSQIG